MLLYFSFEQFTSRQTGVASNPAAAMVGTRPAGRANKPDGSRAIFPLSVIHGGAYTAEELARARRSDSVVAAHYADFGTHPSFRKTPRDLLMYVSYRRGNQVYWSQGRHKIPKGETVIADGSSLARARCGNRLSLTPQHPVAATEQPTEESLNTPEAPDQPVTYTLAELPGPGGAAFPFVLPAGLDSPAAGAAAGPSAAPFSRGGGYGAGFLGGAGASGGGPIMAGSRPATNGPSKAPQGPPGSSSAGSPGTPVVAGTGPGLGGISPPGGPALPIPPSFPPIVPAIPPQPGVNVVPEPSTFATVRLSFLLGILAGVTFLRRKICQ